METKLEKEVRFLKTYAVVATLFCAIFLFSAFVMQGKKQKFEEIDVERVNIVEKDGRLRMVISNEQRQHPGSVDGKIIPREGNRPAGMLFFNERGDEVGGLIFTGDAGKDRFGSLTFDKFRGDQTIALQHLENSEGNYFAGLAFNDENITTPDRTAKVDAIKKLPDEAARNAAYKEMQAKGEFLVRRLSLGRGRNKSAFISLSDSKGRERIQISVTADGKPGINFLDETGKITYKLPEDKKE
jgi:hypothetical protein